jgi:transcriptional regulator GlxA family with amidase domain
MRNVAVIAFDGVVALDLILPAEAFARVRLANGTAGYKVKVCGISSFVQSTVCKMEVSHGLRALHSADTIIVPGVDCHDRDIDERILQALRRAVSRGVRIASVCSGAFVLARAGLLDGRRATTHWVAADALQALYPSIEVDAAVLYVDNGQILTSAGGLAQVDLCLHMIRADYGAAVAAASARYAVTPLERSGGQAQFIVHEPPVPEHGDSLSKILEWIQRNPKADLSVEALARRAGMSGRTFARRFREQTGTTPAKWVSRVRVAKAQELLETVALPIDRIAEEVGFVSATTFRARFREVVGVAPTDYRRTFGAPSH